MPRIDRIGLFALVVSFVFITGCGKAPGAGGSASKDERVLARINNVGLTVSDFKDDAGPLLTKKYLSHSPLKQKGQILEELITKEVMLQEAQKLGLDKERSFMKDIEGYWEQALIKSLISKKLKECSSCLTVSDRDVLDEYARMKRRLWAEMTVFEEKGAVNKLSEVPADWYNAGDLPQKIEDVLFSVKMGEASAPVEYNGNWIVVKVLKEEPNQVASLVELKPRIFKEIIRKKKEAFLEDWNAELRKKASVKIDNGLLKEIDLQ